METMDNEWKVKLRNFVEKGESCEGMIKTPKGFVFCKLSKAVANKEMVGQGKRLMETKKSQKIKEPISNLEEKESNI